MICLSSAGIPTRFETTYLLHDLHFLKIKKVLFYKNIENEKKIYFFLNQKNPIQ